MLNEKTHGFTLTRQREIKELGAVLYEMTHDRTGLELIWLSRDEENKTFCIAFETLPSDNTGVFHILEHSVLCGSERYPVKEPFVELMKGSLNTFLNAMTYPDKTVYPVSSRNDRDFINLMRIYLDAVFCPLIYKKAEIFRQEGWHYELDENGGAAYKGVVFNEMKGAFASADTLAANALDRALFPDSPYGFCSGGDPTQIPKLSYEQFVDSHRRFYSPSNAYVYLDGAMDIDRVLAILNDEYLCKFENTGRIAPPPTQRSVSATVEETYELAPDEPLEGRMRLAYGKVVGRFDEREKLVAVQLLCDVLCGSNQAPLARAILDEELAEDVSLSLSDGIYQPYLVLDIQNLREENIPRIEALVRERIEGFARDGVDRTQLESAMANLEFQLRERDYGSYPQGLALGLSALDTWLYGGDPAANLEIGDLFVHLRERMENGWFEQLLRECFLDSPHSARVLLRPSHTLGEERRAEELSRLAREAARWTAEEREQLLAQQEALLAWQGSEDTPEALATIPQLTLEDIPREPENIPTEELTLSDLPVLHHALHTGGIAYVSLYFDAISCTAEELSVLSFAAGLLGQVGTRQHTAEDIINRTRLLCGSFYVSPAISCVGGDADRLSVRLCLSFSALEANLRQAMALATEVLTQSVFTEGEVRELLRQTRMDLFQRGVMSGHSLGITRIAAQYSALGAAQDAASGVGFYQWIKAQDEQWDFDALSARMSALLTRLVNRSTLLLSAAGIEGDALDALAADAAAAFPALPVLPDAAIKAWGKRREGIVIPADISFATMGGNVSAAGGKFCGQLQLAAQILSLAHLWNAVRVQGGAYGAGLVAQVSGFAGCYSYRDPNAARSLESFRACADFLRAFANAESNYTGFIIGAVANASPLLTPRAKAQSGDNLYFSKRCWEERCRTRRELLNTTPDDLRAIADVLDTTLDGSSCCVVGNRAQLDACRALDTIITL